MDGISGFITVSCIMNSDETDFVGVRLAVGQIVGYLPRPRGSTIMTTTNAKYRVAETVEEIDRLIVEARR